MKCLNKARVIFLLCFLVSIVVTVLGIIELFSVDHDIDDQLTNTEALISSEYDIQSHINQGIHNISNSAQDLGVGVGVLTFQINPVQSTAINSDLSNKSLKTGCALDPNTAFPNEEGNCVLYGHRDSAFRSIPKLKVDDKIEIKTVKHTINYNVDNIVITNPEDPMIYQQEKGRRVTLVTCYPFTMIGPAPQRCVVIAHALCTASQ